MTSILNVICNLITDILSHAPGEKQETNCNCDEGGKPYAPHNAPDQLQSTVITREHSEA